MATRSARGVKWTEEMCQTLLDLMFNRFREDFPPFIPESCWSWHNVQAEFNLRFKVNLPQNAFAGRYRGLWAKYEGWVQKGRPEENIPCYWRYLVVQFDTIRDDAKWPDDHTDFLLKLLQSNCDDYTIASVLNEKYRTRYTIHDVRVRTGRLEHFSQLSLVLSREQRPMYWERLQQYFGLDEVISVSSGVEEIVDAREDDDKEDIMGERLPKPKQPISIPASDKSRAPPPAIKKPPRPTSALPTGAQGLPLPPLPPPTVQNATPPPKAAQTQRPHASTPLDNRSTPPSTSTAASVQLVRVPAHTPASPEPAREGGLSGTVSSSSQSATATAGSKRAFDEMEPEPVLAGRRRDALSPKGGTPRSAKSIDTAVGTPIPHGSLGNPSNYAPQGTMKKSGSGMRRSEEVIVLDEDDDDVQIISISRARTTF
ncbi:hypothetical protein HDU96_002321 [Phlyctochytrium bullatum]|nr:hypothetical protein HDU96_002321 [Phlyctochytrium bullatum]